MTLTMRAVALNGSPLTKPIEARFAPPGGTIGRSSHNTLTLPDPERHISRTQAEIVVDSDGCKIKNVGSANPIMVRGRTVVVGEMVPLLHGDRLRIGGYSLEAIDSDHRVQDSLSPNIESDPLHRSPDRVDSDPSQPGASRLEDWPVMARGPVRDAPASGRPLGVSARTAGTFDLDDEPDGGSGPAPFEGLITGIELVSRAADPLQEFLAKRPSSASPEVTSPAAVSTPRDSDRAPLDTQPGPWLDWPNDAGDAHAAVDASLPPGMLPIHIDDPVVPSLASTDTESMWRAFCEGAGIRLDPAEGASPDLMRIAGSLLRNAVEGTLQMVEVRSALRYELHAQVTVIKPRNNNPLKFAADARSALEQLLQPPLRGFLAGPAAMTDVMNDLVGHAIGTMAGTRAALEGVLARFEPGQLEAQLTDKSVLDSVLPMNRKAKLWELYLLHYGGIRDEAQEDFHALFGRAFLEAYDQQLDRLRREKIEGGS